MKRHPIPPFVKKSMVGQAPEIAKDAIIMKHRFMKGRLVIHSSSLIPLAYCIRPPIVGERNGRVIGEGCAIMEIRMTGSVNTQFPGVGHLLAQETYPRMLEGNDHRKYSMGMRVEAFG